MTTSPHVYTLNARYLKGEGYIDKAQYADGTLALVFDSPDGRERLSINLSAHGLSAPEGHIYVKNYGEHEGFADALIGAGIADAVDVVAYGPFDADATLMKVLI